MQLTNSDWETINSALALLQASGDDAGLRRKGESEVRFDARLTAVREKVHALRATSQRRSGPPSSA